MQNVLSSILNSSMSSRHVRKVLQASYLFTNIHGYHKTDPNRYQSQSTNVISMQYPNTIPNTKMTLPQLVGPIDVVSPEHSSGDRSHEFQIASSKNASIEFSKAEYARPTKAELAHCTTSSRSSKYAQSQKLSSLTSQKYRIFPHPLSREASSIHGVVRKDTHTELKLFQPPTSTPKKIRQDQTLPYPQVSMVTRRVTSAEIPNSPNQVLKAWHS